MDNPPSAPITSPVVSEASSDATQAKAAATSSGCAQYPRGMRARYFSRNLGSLTMVSVILVSAPGAIQLAVMPYLPNSRAQDLVSATTPPLAAESLTCPNVPTTPAADVTVMMRPYSCSLMPSTTALMQ